MQKKTVLWDLDGVIYNGRGTTYLAEGSKTSPEYFIDRFKEECGYRGPLSDIEPEKFMRYLSVWETEQGTKIDSAGKLGAALTDFRHKYGLFTSKHTKYTKNAILKGISMKDINEIMENIPLNNGFENTVRGFREDEKQQIIFSNASYPIAVVFQKKYGMDYAEGIPVWVRDKEQEYIYTPEMHGNPDIVLAGRLVDERWDKLQPFLNYIKEENLPLVNIAAIDDDHFRILERVQQGGGIAVGYKVKKKYRQEFEKRSIPVLKGDDLRAFGEIVNNPKEMWRYCK